MICREKYDSVPYCGSTVQGKFLVCDFFIAWYKQNMYSLKSMVSIQLDKDILGDNKVYSEDTVLLIPYYINYLFINSKESKTGAVKRGDKFEVYIADFFTKKRTYVGKYRTFEEAHNAWAASKTKQLHEVVVPYFMDDIPSNYKNNQMVVMVRDNLLNYTFR